MATATAGNGTDAATSQQLKEAQNFTLETFFASLIVAFAVFGAQVAIFLLLKQKLPRIYQPRTYLVPRKERTAPPPPGFFGWITPVFRTSNSDFIHKCGLDAYFFLRFLRMLLKLFIPMACVILPILLPLNSVKGRGRSYMDIPPFDKDKSQWSPVSGLNALSWGNVRPDNTGRYWAHLLLAVAVIVYCWYTFYDELRGYIRLRQAYMTSPQHRIRASATTVLVSAIPRKWCTVQALDGLYDVFPGGIRNIWLNRDFDALNEKVDERNKIAKKLESAQTELIKKAKKKQMEQAAKEAKKDGRSKMDRQAEKKRQDAEGAAMAASKGVSSGNPHQVHHTLDGVLNDTSSLSSRSSSPHREKRTGVAAIPVFGQGIEAVGHGISNVGKNVGRTIFGGVRHLGKDVDNRINTTQGFVSDDGPERRPGEGQMDGVADGIGPGYKVPYQPAGSHTDQSASTAPQTATGQERPMLQEERHAVPDLPSDAATHDWTSNSPDNATLGNVPRSPETNRSSRRPLMIKINEDGKPKNSKTFGFRKTDQKNILGMPSPTPKGHDDEFPLTKKSFESSGTRGAGPKSKFGFLKFWEKEPIAEEEYPEAYDKDYNPEEDDEPLWKKYLKPGDRDTMRLPIFGIKWLSWLPFVGQKVDTIDYCRKELARFNLEIETDQKNPEKYPLMNSAFIQFNHQVAAHMACQTISHHIPSQMAPRIVEISPDDVIWSNMSIKWWERYIRIALVTLAVGGLVLGWAFPVAFTGLLANIKYLASSYTWLGWLEKIPPQLISPIQGVLPQLLLAILLAILPLVLRLLARLQGHATGMAVELAVSNFYFFFLFVQVFLIVTISSGTTNVFSRIGDIGSKPQDIPALLAQSLPSASNYFFSYMLLQAFSTSAGTLVQIASLLGWFVLGPMLDSTAREKWRRQITLPKMRWGTFFPVYTNLAVIGLIYSVIAPLILVFNVITFSLFWFVYRYNTLYVTKFKFDTGGLLFPKAINQLFTGLYVMELCLIGLFFLTTGVDEETGEADGTPCFPQAIIMIIMTIFTVLYQFLLNHTFGPLFRYLPITLEDEAVIRDEEFARCQQKKFNLVEDEQEGDDINDVLEARERREQEEDAQAEAIELQEIQQRKRRHRLDPRTFATTAADTLSPLTWTTKRRRSSAWAHDSARPARDGNAQEREHTVRQHRLRQNRADVEAGVPKKALETADALFSGINDEIQDLSPEDRDFLVQRAFQHECLRARRPVIWIPRDDLGVSDDEIARTRKFSDQIWISNEHTGLDSRAKVLYQKSPPDFSEVDLIEL